MRRRLSLMLVAALGMVGTAAAAVATPAVSTSPLTVRTVDLPNAKGATEPSLVIDSKGRIYVSAIFGFPGNLAAPGTPVWRSTDGARTFSRHSTASAGPLATPLSGGDSALVLDKRGSVYATDLWLGNDSIAVSTDQAQSWLGSPVSHRMVGDRNWLAYSPKDDAIYQIWNGIDALYVARADVGGPLGEKAALTFANNYRLAGEVPGLPEQYVRDNSAWPGGIAVDQRTGTVYATWSDQNGVAIAVSEDKGATWSISHIPGSKVTGSYLDTAWNYAPVGVDARGNVYVTWTQIKGASVAAPEGISVHVAVAPRGAQRWRSMTVPTRATAVFAQLAVRGVDDIALAWVDATERGNPNNRASFGSSTWRLQYAEVTGLAAGRPRLATQTIDPAVHENTLFVGSQGGDRGMGDFFSMAVTPARDVVIAYSRGQQGSSQPRVALVGRR